MLLTGLNCGVWLLWFMGAYCVFCFAVVNLFVGSSCAIVLGFGTLGFVVMVDLVVLVYVHVCGFDCVVMWVVCVSLGGLVFWV